MSHLKQVSPGLVAMAIALGKCLVTPTWEAAFVFLIGAALYAFCRYEAMHADRETDADREIAGLLARVELMELRQSQDFNKIGTMVADIAGEQNAVNSIAKETQKQQEEIKKVLSANAIANTFRPPVRRNQHTHAQS